jgi:3-hydroxyacyl-CoA dehydrogenase/enoyl-CoA hydratase/3-hydroxybutyryl-CoA epimerase
MESALRTTTDPAGILTIWMDVPGKSVNTCTPGLLAELAELLATIERVPPTAGIITSAKPRSFNAGADLFELRKMTPAQRAEYLALGQSLFERIAHLPITTAAAINGDCLGGGFELALACTCRVAAGRSNNSIGLPEVKLGLIPAWGGTTRLPSTIGLTKALPILLAGKTMPPSKALRAGLIDEVVRPEALLAAARRLALAKPSRREPAALDRVAASIGPIRRQILRAARRRVLATTFGNYPAPLRLLEVVETGNAHGPAAGLEAERSAITDLADTDASRNLLRIFALRQEAKKRATASLTAPPSEVKYGAVIGGGTMGAGIAHALARAGIFVRLVEIDAAAASAALGRIARMLADDVSAGRADKIEARDAMNRISPCTDWTGLELADFVVEAVVETIAAKREVFTKLDRLCRPTAVLASNTSSLRIAEMAEATLHPERVIGMHFFNPVPKMPLVEIIRAPHGDDAALATAVALAGKIGKTPILVNDAPGFVVNRVLIPYLGEALVMAGEGASIPAVDLAMKQWGMPMGPFELLDEIGLDVADHVLKSLHAPPSAALERALANHWLGKKSGRGFYVYSKGRGKKPALNRELTASASAAMADDARATTQRRLLAPMIDAASKLLEEGVTDSAETIDLATVLGLGLAPFRGGLARYAGLVAPRRESIEAHSIET